MENYNVVFDLEVTDEKLNYEINFYNRHDSLMCYFDIVINKIISIEGKNIKETFEKFYLDVKEKEDTKLNFSNELSIKYEHSSLSFFTKHSEFIVYMEDYCDGPGLNN